MKAVVQRVNSASVRVGNKTVGEIDRGLLIYLGIAQDDGPEQVAWLADKIVNLRMFDQTGTLQSNDLQPDAETAGNSRTTLSLLDIAGKVLVISQFTLLADTRRGRRPSFSQAAEPAMANTLYLAFVEAVGAYVLIQSGEFGADMQVSSENDGPFTLILEHPPQP